ncbi:sigma 54-interacting transcriptional regulator [Virgibacillus sp. NKC19-16]|uniref:sigma 54-interacting transcriptional regulator n=1 Tax=Virgibacillus salidurans TaxID=2831673 RepID=UPI001F1BEEB6|nr:sigma-54-dependent transcriptional regulator [Virgibacillus sp. NKC19-16]UJL45611.1 sigma 54-interacting transcriptional regulator [Virgibacillus sp. NKC19-16]
MSRIMDIYKQLGEMSEDSVTADEVGEQLEIDRSTASRYLNDLVKVDKVVKIPGKPVRYSVKTPTNKDTAEPDLIGSDESLHPILETGMAAFLYPSKPLPILLTGETGTGKSYMAEKLSQLAIEKSDGPGDIPFVAFNCADYAQNPELLVGQIFGIKEGAFTGATENKVGLVEKANGGILFLDEIHRLPPSGQEMLFYLIDNGVYHRLGEATQENKADVAFIGATTESPEDVLLPTLMRRFSIKLNIPPLRERTASEREELLDYFLREEASKMNARLSIAQDCRRVFLTYECPGNIGQLKSDIQIACARAYYRYLNRRQDEVVIKLEDFPGDMANRRENGNPPQQIEVNHAENVKQSDFPNIYQRLDDTSKDGARQNSKKDLQNVVKDYITDLMQKYKHPPIHQHSWQQLIDDDLFQALASAKRELQDILSFSIQDSQLYVIGLHLQNYRNHLREDVKKESIPVMIHPNASYRQAANRIAHHLHQQIGMDLPQEEIELIAHFITPENQHRDAETSESNIGVLLVTHGKSTASSMAEVANYLLGNEVIHAVDMPLNISAEETYERVIQTINGWKNEKGVLLLVDIGSLITMGDAIRHELNIPIQTLSSVNLSMVMEAGRQSLVSDQTLDGIYEETKQAMLKFVKKEAETTSLQKRRLIATVCFTGEGAAQLLESWIANQLSAMDEDVLVRTVRIDPTSKDTSVLMELKEYYEVIAIIGTVPVSIDGIPYIPAWELLQEEGISRMHKLLEITRKPYSLTDVSSEISTDEIHPLIVRGLQEIVTFGNPKMIADLLDKRIPPIRDYYNWANDRELGMWMHIGGMIDRLISNKMKNDHDKLISSFPLDSQTVLSDQEQEIWDPFFQDLEETFNTKIPTEIRRELVKLSR